MREKGTITKNEHEREKQCNMKLKWKKKII